MLSLSRKKGQSIIVVVDNKEIEFIIDDISASKVQVKVGADQSVKIWRKELYESIKQGEIKDFKDIKENSPSDEEIEIAVRSGNKLNKR
jgi:carbon storage regulator CsrA